MTPALAHTGSCLQGHVTDANGESACICCQCKAFVHTSLVQSSNLYCAMCRQVKVQTSARRKGVHVEDAPASILAAIRLPPPGSILFVTEAFPKGKKVPWLRPQFRIIPHVRDRARCANVECRAELTEADNGLRGTCRRCSDNIMYKVSPTGFEEVAWCGHCCGWRSAHPWPMVTRQRVLVRGTWCARCKWGDAAEEDDGSLPGCIQFIKRFKGRGGRLVLIPRQGLHASDGLPWMQSAPKRGPRSEVGGAVEDGMVVDPEVCDAMEEAEKTVSTAAIGEKRTRKGNPARPLLCRVAGCIADATVQRWMCDRHALQVVHEEVAAGECAHQRFCFACRSPKNAYEFTWDGRCHPSKCAKAGHKSRKAPTPGRLPCVGKVVAGVQWPQVEDGWRSASPPAVPTFAQCQEVADLFLVGVLYAPSISHQCRYSPPGGRRCDESHESDVCENHVGVVAVCVRTAGLRWTCPRCRVEKGLEARGSGLCMACHSAVHIAAVTGSTEAGARMNAIADATAQTADVDSDVGVVDVCRSTGIPVDVEDGQTAGPADTADECIFDFTTAEDGVQGGVNCCNVPQPSGVPPCDGSSQVHAFAECLFDFACDEEWVQDEGHAASEPALAFVIGGSTPTNLPLPDVTLGRKCTAPMCEKVIGTADGIGGVCNVCVSTRMQEASVIDLLALMVVPGALHNGQGLSHPIVDVCFLLFGDRCAMLS